MCGIFALLNNENNETKISQPYITEQFNKAKHRGPDNSCINTEKDFIGFHRLAINGLDEESNQPFNINNISLVCNGEIYNYKELYNNISYKPTTNSDCEIIIYLYMTYGIEYTLNLLDGVFAFILIDYNINKLFVARDPYGIRPLFYLYNPNIIFDKKYNTIDKDNLIGFASEMKQLIGILYKKEKEKEPDSDLLIRQVAPGEFMSFELSSCLKWFLIEQKVLIHLK